MVVYSYAISVSFAAADQLEKWTNVIPLYLLAR